MAKAPFKHPSVFVACQYSPAAAFKTFRAALKRVPLEFHYADSAIRTAHVLERIRRGIVRCDYSLFDITNWNANVTLELGLAEGLNKDYYILFKPGRGKKSEPPSDIKGLQRIQYKKIDGFTDDCLTYQINLQLVQKLTHPRYIYEIGHSLSRCESSRTSRTTRFSVGATSSPWRKARTFETMRSMSLLRSSTAGIF